MIGSSTNLTAGSVVSDGSTQQYNGQVQQQVQNVARCEAPAPALTLPYTGRVGTFYNAVLSSYCENYQPPRDGIHGLIGRIESRYVGGRWRHLAYRVSGALVSASNDDYLIFDQTNMPLMFDPATELRFAMGWLDSSHGKEVINLPNGVVVYGNTNRSSVGIVRLKVTV